MARDYRYGHKKKPVATRRSQEEDSVLKSQTPVASAKSSPLMRAASRRTATASAEPSPAPEPEPVISAVDAPPAAPVDTPELVSEPEPAKAVKSRAKKKPKSKLAQEAEGRKSTEAPTEAPTLAVESASDSGISNTDDDDEPVTKKRFFWLKLTGLLFLLTSVTAWLVYAPLILAFLLDLGVIDEETRLRWDSREARQPQVAFVEKVLPVVSETPQAEKSTKTDEVEDEAHQSVNFTFYEELPKAEILLSAEPLPVRTKAPTYLQLSAFAQAKDANEEKGRLAQKGYLTRITPRVAQNGKPVHVLMMGPYEDQRDINRLKVELQKLGVDAKEVTMSAVMKAQERSQERLQEKH
jgi:cell division septation protein DedD